MVTQFETYAEKRYISSLQSGKADDHTILGAVRYVQTRGIKDHETSLRELFTDPPAGELRNQIAEACLDAMIGTSAEPVSTARFLAGVATSVKPLPSSSLAERSLWRLPEASEKAILSELTRPYNGRRLRKFARLLIRLSKVGSPEPIAFWQEADAVQRTSAANVWRERIRRARSG